MSPMTSDSRKNDPMKPAGVRAGDRFVLWVDAVGGYWVCLGDEVVLGQAGPPGADVPLLADLSARHARIRRDGEGYLIEAFREVYLEGRKVDHLALLSDGNRVQLGTSVRLLFRRPHALSATARLDFLSRHRTQPSTDAVLLMADACVLGPTPFSHVVCPELKHEVVLCRRDERLVARSPGKFAVDGVPCRDQALLLPNSRVVGTNFSLSLEPI
jgi:hypothetical protein